MIFITFFQIAAANLDYFPSEEGGAWAEKAVTRLAILAPDWSRGRRSGPAIGRTGSTSPFTTTTTPQSPSTPPSPSDW